MKYNFNEVISEYGAQYIGAESEIPLPKPITANLPKTIHPEVFELKAERKRIMSVIEDEKQSAHLVRMKIRLREIQIRLYEIE